MRVASRRRLTMSAWVFWAQATKPTDIALALALARHEEVTVEQTHLRGWWVIMDSIADQVNGQYVVPEQVQMTAQVSALTIGQVLDESELATGDKCS